MSQILIAALILGGLGLASGALLAIVGRKFAVETDPRQQQVRDCLPGANCGGCGYAGCDGYAAAVASGEATTNKCPVGGDPVAQKVAEVMGVTAEPTNRLVAAVMCRGDLESCKIQFDYNGPRDCKSAALAANGDKACRYSCLGHGDCEVVCPFDAIHVGPDRLARVDEDACQGCGLCVTACPRNVIKLLPASHPVHRTCSAMERGKMVRDNCTAGCIGCGKCEKSCKFGALVLKDNLPQIDLDKCVGCMQCADNCPTGALKSNEAFRRHALIEYSKCVGCGECQKVCQFEAILGEPNKHHSVVDWNCVGCGACEPACSYDCIQMVQGMKYRAK